MNQSLNEDKSDEVFQCSNTIHLIENILRENAADYEIIEHDEPIRTKSDAEKYFNPDETVPSLILKTEKGYYALVLSGKREKLDFKYLKKLLSLRNLALAGKSEIMDKLKMEVGQIPLIGHGLPTIIDNWILKYDYVYGGCGDLFKTLKIKPQDLIEANEVVLFLDM